MAEEITDVQIASMVSDTRVEQSYEVQIPGATKQAFNLVDFPTIDDLMLHGMKQAAAAIKFSEVEYSSIMERDLVTVLTRTQLPLVTRS